MELTLKGVRLAFADIWTARPPQDGKGDAKFGATFILDPKKNAAEVKQIRDAIKKVAKEKWPKNADKVLRVIEGDNQKFCWFEEDYLNQEGDPVDGFEGMFYLRSKSPIQPGIYDRDRTELARGDGRPYPGCFVVAKVDIWAQDNAFGKGLRAQLKGVQFLRDGDSFGGGTRSSADDFEDLSDLGEEDETPSKPARGRRQPEPAEDDDDVC